MERSGDTTNSLSKQIAELQNELKAVKKQLEEKKTETEKLSDELNRSGKNQVNSEELFGSELFHRKMIESSPDSIVIADLKGKIEYFSPVSIQMFGYPEGTDIKGRSIFEFLKDSDHTKAAKFIEEMFQDKFSGAAEYTGIKADGTGFDIEINGQIIKDTEGQVRNMLFVTRDISDRKRMEESLVESERRISTMMNNLPGMVYRCLNDTNWTMLFMSEGCKELTGYPAKIFVGEKALAYNDIIHPDDREHVAKTVAKGLKRGNSFEIEYRIISAEGEVKHVWEKGKGVIDQRKVKYLEGFIMDVSDLTELTRENEKKEKEFRRMVESIHDVFYEITGDGKFVYVSPASVRIFGFTPEELNGQPLFNYVVKDDLPMLLNAFKTGLNKAYNYLEYRIYNKEGEIRWVRSSTTPIFEDGKLVGGSGSMQDITERKLAELALLSNEKRLAQITEQSHTVIWEVDKDGLYTFVSPVAEKVWGYKPEELIGNVHFFDLSPEEDRKAFLETRDAFNKEKKVISEMIHPIIRKDGEVIMVSTNGVPVEDEKGNLLGYRGADNDVTEKISAEKLLEENESKYRSIFENIQDVYFEASMEGKVTEISPSIFQLSRGQYTREDAIGLTANDIYAFPEERAGYRDLLLRDGKVDDYELTFKNRDGSPIPITVTTVLMKDENGQPFKLIGSIRDISERKDIETQIRESENKYRSIFENIQDVYIEVSLDGRITEISPSISQFGPSPYQLEDLLNQPLSVIAPKGTEEVVVGKIMKDGFIHDEEILFINKDGSQSYISLVAKIVIDEEGHPQKMVGVMRDIGERKQAEEKVKQSETKFRSIFENIQDVYFESELDGKIIEISPSIIHLSKGQLIREDIIGKSAFDFYKSGQKRDELLALLQKDGFVLNFENELVNRNGEVIPVSVSASLVADSSGNPFKMVGSIHDISAQKQVENVLRESEARYKSMFYDNKSVMLVINPDNGKIEDANEAAIEYYGWEARELLSKKITEINVKTSEEVNKLLQKTKKGKSIQFEFQHRLASGEIRDVNVYTGPIQVGEKTLLQSIIFDITARNRAMSELNVVQAKVRENEIKYRSIFENLQDVYYEASLEGIILEISPSVATLSNGQYNREELIGKSVVELYAKPEERARFFEHIFATGRVSDFELMLRNKDGEMIPVAITSVVQKNQEGKPVKIIGNIRDITERKKTAEELQQSEERYKSVFTKSESVMLLVNPTTGNIVDANRAACNFYGWNIKELTSKSIFDINTLDKETLLKEMERAQNEERKQFVFQHRLANGDIRHVEIFVSSMQIEDQKYNFEVIQDITDRYKAEQEVLRSEEELNKSQEIARMGSWKFNFITGTMDWSDNMFNILGVDRQDGILSFADFVSQVHPNDQSLFNVQAVEPFPDEISTEYRFIKKSGELIWIKNNYIAIYDNGQIVGLQGTNIDITERKEAEQALRESEQELNTAQEIAGLGSWEFDLQTKEVKLSDNYYRIMGVEPGSVEDPFSFFLSLLSKEDGAKVYQTIDEAVSTGKPVIKEITINPVNGNPVQIRNTSQAEFVGNIPVKLRGVFIDITEAKKAEQTIVEQSRRVNAVIEAIPDMIFVIDREGNYLEYYCSSDQDLLLPRDQILNSNMKDTFPPEAYQFHKSKLDESFNSGKLITYTYSVPMAGQEFHFEARMNKMDKNRVVTIVQNITDKYLQSQEISKLSMAIRQSPVVTVITDLEGNIEYVNPAFEKVTQYTYDEVLGKNPRILQSGNTNPDEYEEMWRAIKHGMSWRGEWQNRKKNGDLYWEDVYIAPFKDERGVLTKFLAVKLDITERKKADQEILELNRSLENKVERRTNELSKLNKQLIHQVEEEQRIQKELQRNQTLLETMSDSTNLGFIVVNVKDRIIPYANRRSLELGGVLEMEAKIRERDFTLEEIVPIMQQALARPEDFDEKIRFLFDPDNSSDYNMEIDFSGNRTIHLFSTILLTEDEEYYGRLFMLDDITSDKKEAVFQSELLDLSTQLTGIPLEKVVPSIQTALHKIGEIMQADRTYIFEFDENKRKTISNTYEWVADGISAEIENTKNLPVEFFPGWFEKLQDDQNIWIPNVDEMPEEWGELQKIMQSQQIKSLIIVPLKNEDQLIGFAGLDFVGDYKQAQEKEFNNLQLWSTILAALINYKRVGELLEQSRQNYSTFFNTIDDFLLVVDKEGKIMHANETVTRRLKYSAEELIGMSVLSIRPVARREEAALILKQMLAGTINECSIPIESKDRKEIMVETRVKEGKWNGVEAMFVVSKDISEIKLSEEKFSKAFHSSVALMAISESDTMRILEVNSTWLNVLGFTKEEVIGKTPGELKIIPDNEEVRRASALIMEKKIVRDVELTILTKHGETRTGLFSTENIIIGNEASTLSVLVDITDRKKMEDELREARQEAEKANAAKSEFLSRMSHELRTPMNSILGFSQLLERGELNAKQLKAANHIRKSGKHLLNLINEVLDISRIEAGRMLLSFEPVSLHTLIEQTIDIIRPQAIERNIKIEISLNPGVPEYIKADMQRMKQVLLNLLSNAIKYNKDSGKVIVDYELVKNEGQERVRINICDTGYGIVEEDLAKLFTPFERIGAEHTPTEGTGLGLSVTKKLVEAMEGQIGVRSTFGEGSNFWVEMQSTSLPQKAMKDSYRFQNEGERELHQGTIVYVEDNPSNIELVENIISEFREGLQLKAVSDGSLAVQLILQNLPDLIVLDLNLPGMDGDFILDLLRKDDRTKHIPVVILSADAMPQRIESLKKKGADDYMTKPIDIEAFIDMLDRFLISKNQ